MTCIIIDDEKHCIGTLEILINRQFPEITILASCSNGPAGIAAIEQYHPDFILLDISMPKMNGFEMLSKIDNPQFKVIFTTAYDSFAIKAFKVSAVDYLLKPIDHTELKLAIEKVKKQQQTRKSNHSPDYLKHQLNLFLENIHQTVQVFPNIAIPTMEGMEMVKAESIIYLESDSNYSTCHLQDSTTVTVTKTLKEMEQVLDKYNFCRIHRSYLININHMTKYMKGEGGYVIMDNNKNIDVSRRKKDLLMTKLKH